MSATEMLCFTGHLGLIIGDLVPKNSDLWTIYIIVEIEKQIIDIITAKNISKECPILLNTLITEHHELYLQLFKTNLKPKHHHFVHYPDIMKKIEPLCHIWSMRFESKHRESKMTATSITSRKYICYTLTLKHQLKLAYRIILQNILSSEIHYGNVINISNDTINDIKNDLIENPNIDDFTSAKFVSWVEVKNIKYSLKNMTLILDISDMPLFVLIKFICFLPDNYYPYLIYNKFTTVKYDEHVQKSLKLFLCKNLIMKGVSSKN